MKKKSIVTNYIYYLSFQVLNVILPLITAPYISRVLGASNLGIYSYTDSLTAFFLLFATLGILQYGSREIACHRDNKKETSVIFWELVIFKIFTSVIGVLLFISYFLLFESKNTLIYGILSINFLSNALDIGWFYNGLENFKASSLKNSIVKLLGVLLVFLLVKDEGDLPLYVFCMVIPTLLGNVLLWVDLKRSLTKISLKELQPLKHVKNILVFFIPAVSAQIYHMVDKLMLQWVLKNDYQNGIYSQAYKIIVVVMSVILAYNSVMFSRMSNLYAKKEQESIAQHLKKSVSFVEMLGLAMSVGLFVIAPRFVPVFFGDGYEEVITLIRIFSPMILITGLSNMVANQCLIPAGKQRKTNIAIVSGALVNVLLNLLLIPLFGAVGASIATLCCEVVILVIVLCYAKNVFSIIVSQSVNYIFASIILGISVFGLDLTLPHGNGIFVEIIYLGVMIIVGISVYFGFLMIRKDKLVCELFNSLSSKFRFKK